jgi:hypothetical protein
MEWMLPPSAAKIDSRASSKGMSKPAYSSDSAKSSLEHMRSDFQARLPAHSSKQQQIDQQLRHLQVPRLFFLRLHYNFLLDTSAVFLCYTEGRALIMLLHAQRLHTLGRIDHWEFGEKRLQVISSPPTESHYYSALQCRAFGCLGDAGCVLLAVYEFLELPR